MPVSPYSSETTTNCYLLKFQFTSTRSELTQENFDFIWFCRRWRFQTLVPAVLRPASQTPLNYEWAGHVSIGRYHLKNTDNCFIFSHFPGQLISLGPSTCHWKPMTVIIIMEIGNLFTITHYCNFTNNQYELLITVSNHSTRCSLYNSAK